jgi:hypothetical protein
VVTRSPVRYAAGKASYHGRVETGAERAEAEAASADRRQRASSFAAISGTGTTWSGWRATPEAGTEQGTLRAGSRWFAPVEEGEFGNGQLRTADSLVATVATHSRLLVMDEGERARTLAAIRDLLHRRPETSDGEFTLPLVTAALRAVRRP